MLTSRFPGENCRVTRLIAFRVENSTNDFEPREVFYIRKSTGNGIAVIQVGPRLGRTTVQLKRVKDPVSRRAFNTVHLTNVFGGTFFERIECATLYYFRVIVVRLKTIRIFGNSSSRFLRHADVQLSLWYVGENESKAVVYCPRRS